MKKIKTSQALALAAIFPAVLALAACNTSEPAAEVSSSSAAGARDLHNEEANRKLVVDFYNKFFNEHEPEEAAEVVADDYIQHNPSVPDGKEPFVSFFSGYFLENPESKAEIVRSSTDGDLVYLHVRSTDASIDKETAVVDIFRVEDGKILEHWDVIQDVPDESANLNTMF
ncbi:ester cyclase [Glutamicibacter sp. NPDC087344]|uniref:nuclear transport factor 2 family protein n=1 Tax=Glutamicibacter sp. NPDC087344 TaxID=3363994 RepID=UPI00380403ED